MTTTEQYDAVIVGAGQAGVPLAQALGTAGWKTALIEREHVGGTCVNRGCTPTKTMAASARVAYLARRAADYGVNPGGPVTVDMRVVRQRKRDMVESFRQGSTQRLQNTANVDLLTGEGHFTGPRRVEVRLNGRGVRRLTAERVFINVGARPFIPPVAGLADTPYLDSTSIMELDAVPGHLIVLGGGYIAVEFAQMFRRFGSAVTVVQRSEQLLSREDDDIAEAVAEILREDGIDVLLNTEAVCAERTRDGVSLAVRTPDGERIVAGAHLLVATGRTPNTDSLDLGAAGVETDRRGFISVNARLETSAPGVYALGDCKGGPEFTHISYDDYRVVRANLLDGGDAGIETRLVPYTVFMDPQLGRVGLTEREARERGLSVRVARMPMRSVARALETDETRGLMKAVVDADTGRVLGCAVLGIGGGEVMTIVQMAMMGDLPYTALRDGVFAHPTLAEALNNLFARLE